jgi:hypothetical protein
MKLMLFVSVDCTHFAPTGVLLGHWNRLVDGSLMLHLVFILLCCGMARVCVFHLFASVFFAIHVLCGRFFPISITRRTGPTGNKECFLRFWQRLNPPNRIPMAAKVTLPLAYAGILLMGTGERLVLLGAFVGVLTPLCQGE